VFEGVGQGSLFVVRRSNAGMTLLVTEIHNHDEPDDARIVFAADRRITRNDRYADTRKKIFEIPRLHAGIGYFGLAEVGSGTSAEPMEEWLRRYLRQNTAVSTLAEFSHALAEGLNKTVPESHRQRQPSGFHIAGFDNSGRVEFWFVRNVEDDRATCTGTYSAREEFQRRDKANLRHGEHQIYRNGDLLPHVLLWEQLDRALMPLLNRDDFRPVQTSDEYIEWVRFKMEVIAYVYKKYCERPVIGRPIDAFCVRFSKRHPKRGHV
jgi:hypothetical protein